MPSTSSPEAPGGGAISTAPPSSRTTAEPGARPFSVRVNERGAGRNTAVTVSLAYSVRAQGPLPRQPADHPANT
ncbi:MAG: hypothetical protein FJ318_09890 [SAR202 cluster bacterium]|nr:hypothetical protein [SAR202 cluster bacterium]